MWDKIVEKAIDIEVKTSLKLPSGTRKIDFRYPKGYRPVVKKDKDNSNQEYRDEDKNKDKTKSHNHFSTNS